MTHISIFHADLISLRDHTSNISCGLNFTNFPKTAKTGKGIYFKDDVFPNLKWLLKVSSEYKGITVSVSRTYSSNQWVFFITKQDEEC